MFSFLSFRIIVQICILCVRARVRVCIPVVAFLPLPCLCFSSHLLSSCDAPASPPLSSVLLERERQSEKETGHDSVADTSTLVKVSVQRQVANERPQVAAMFPLSHQLTNVGETLQRPAANVPASTR